MANDGNFLYTKYQYWSSKYFVYWGYSGWIWFYFDKKKVINDEKKIDIKCHFMIIDCKNDDLLHPDSNKVCDNLCYLGISIDDPCTIDDMLR